MLLEKGLELLIEESFSLIRSLPGSVCVCVKLYMRVCVCVLCWVDGFMNVSFVSNG